MTSSQRIFVVQYYIITVSVATELFLFAQHLRLRLYFVLSTDTQFLSASVGMAFNQLFYYVFL